MPILLYDINFAHILIIKPKIKMKTKGIRLQMLIFSIMVIGAGILLFLFKTGMLPVEYKSIIFSWQMLLISLGTLAFFSRPHPHAFMGILLILIGGLFMLSKFNYPPLIFLKENLLPAGLLIAGLLICIGALFGRRYKSKCHHKHHLEEWHKKHGYSDAYTTISEEQITEEWKKEHETHAENIKKEYSSRKPEVGYIYRDYIFGGGKENFGKGEFKGGDINCVFGGIELDLTECQLAEGINNLSISTVFGGAVLYIPFDWKVELRQESIFGHFEDKRPKPTFELDNSKVLMITVSCVFGGGELKTKTV